MANHMYIKMVPKRRPEIYTHISYDLPLYGAISSVDKYRNYEVLSLPRIFYAY